MPKGKPAAPAKKPAKDAKDAKKKPVEDAAPTAEQSAATYPARIDDLLAQVSTPVTDAARAWLAKQISDTAARSNGVKVGSPSVLDAVIETFHVSQHWIVAQKVAGYGPMRLRYLLELSRELAGKVAQFDASIIGAAGASAAKGSSLRVARDDRRSALRVLRNFAGQDVAAKARLQKVRGRDERPDERAQSLQAIAKELATATAGVPPELVADAGVSHELGRRLDGYAHAVVSTHDTAHEARAGIASQYDAMNVLDGRILHELRVLEGSMRDARKADKQVPALRIRVLRNKSARKKAKADGATGTSGAEGTKPVG